MNDPARSPKALTFNKKTIAIKRMRSVLIRMIDLSRYCPIGKFRWVSLNWKFGKRIKSNKPQYDKVIPHKKPSRK
jgi:hypothetical protein